MQVPPPEESEELRVHRATTLAAVWRHLHSFCPSRFDVYQHAYGPDCHVVAAHYLWNMQVSQALLPTLLSAEMMLRNTINAHLVKLHGEFWFDRPGFLGGPELDAVARARQDATHKERMRGRLMNHDDIVIELSFRFWANLLMSTYSRSIWNHLLIYGAFPHLPANLSDKRRAARHAFVEAATLRNRVCHGERVIHLPNLPDTHREIQQAIMWMSKPYGRMVRGLCQFDHIWNNGLNECLALLSGMVRPPDPND